MESTATTPDDLQDGTSKHRGLGFKNSESRSVSLGSIDAVADLRFLDDIFTTCVDLKWRYIFLGFSSSFLISWLIFAGIWHFMFWAHGDLEEMHLPEAQEESNWTPCVYNIYDFSSTFLYSVETQHTIGYGLRGSSHKCADTIILQCIQSIVGVLIQACIAGIVFAKLARPKKRAKTISFSSNAVISQVNGKLRLMFRIANIRNSQILEAHFRAILLNNITTKEGVTLRNFPTEMSLSTQLSEEEQEPTDFGHMFLPLLVSHCIDETSPLYELTPAELITSKFEILVTLEGVVEPSGNTTQVRTSYIPQEILWGHSFTNCVSYANKEGVYLIDHSKIDTTITDCTPRLSAKQIDEENRRAQ